MERLTGSTELENDGTGAHATAEEIQEKTALLPDYGFKNSDSTFGTSFPELRDPQSFLLSVSVHAMHSASLKRKSHKLHGTGEK